jgi:hypothetical protein
MKVAGQSMQDRLLPDLFIQLAASVEDCNPNWLVVNTFILSTISAAEQCPLFCSTLDRVPVPVQW